MAEATGKDKERVDNAKIATDDVALKFYTSQQGMGHEDAPIMSLPRLLIVSSQMRGYGDKDHVMAGHEPGMIWYTGNDTFGDSITVTPCYYHEQYTEYSDPKGRGAPCAVHQSRPLNAEWDEGLNKLMLPNNHVLKRTGVVYGILHKEGLETQPFVVYMASTQYPKFLDWVKVMKTPRPAQGGAAISLPPWAMNYNMRTRQEEDRQNKWHGWVITQNRRLLDPRKEPVTSAITLYASVKGNYAKMGQQRIEVDTNVPLLSDDIPF